LFDGSQEQAKEARGLLKKMGDSARSCDFEKYMAEFKEKYAANKKLMDYFTTHWEACLFDWVLCKRQEYHDGIETNNNVERHHRSFKKKWLQNRRNLRLDSVIEKATIAAEKARVEYYLSQLGASTHHRLQADRASSFLHNIPPWTASHLARRMTAGFRIADEQVQECSPLECIVKGETLAYRANLHLGNGECPDFMKWRLPCKHMWAAARHFNFDPADFPSSILNHPKMVLYLPFGSPAVQQPNRRWEEEVGNEEGVGGDKENIPPRSYCNKKTNDRLRLITNLANICAPEDEEEVFGMVDQMACAIAAKVPRSSEGLFVRADVLRDDHLYNTSRCMQANLQVASQTESSGKTQSSKRRATGVKTTQGRLLVRRKASK